MVRAITSGLSSAFAERRLVLLLWLLNLGLAMVVAVPFWLWGWGALGSSIEGSVFAAGWDAAAFADLMEEASSAIVAFSLVTAVTLAIAAIGSAFVSSGTLGVLLARRRERAASDGAPASGRAVMGQFFEAGGRFFWRSLGLRVLTAIAALVVVGIAYGGARAATRPLEDSLTEAGAWIRLVAPLGAGALAFLFWMLVLDFARIALVAFDRRGVWRTWTAGLKFVARHLAGVVGLWLVFAVFTLVAAGIYLAATGIVHVGSGTSVAVVAVFQQLFMLWRTAVHVGLVSGQLALAAGHDMAGLAPPPVTASVPPTAAPLDLELTPVETPVGVGAPIEGGLSTVPEGATVGGEETPGTR